MAISAIRSAMEVVDDRVPATTVDARVRADRVDVRVRNLTVNGASNRDLRQAVSDGSFREDLFYRLQVFDIRIPPLRERRGDIPLLADAFLQELERSTGCSSAGLTPDARAALVGHDWPGNVRELHNALELRGHLV